MYLFLRYFLDAPNVDGVYVMRQNVQSGMQYEYIYNWNNNFLCVNCKLCFQLGWKFHNASGGLNQACVKANPGEEWKCLMAQVHTC